MQTFLLILAYTAAFIRLIYWLSNSNRVSTNSYSNPNPTNRFAQPDFGPPPHQENQTKAWLDDSEIKRYIHQLRKEIPEQPTVSNLPYVPNNDQGPENWSAETMESYYEAYVKEMADFLRITVPVKTMVVTTIDFPAQFTYYDGVQLLQVKQSVRDHSIYRAYIAFGMTQCYLFSHYVEFPDTSTYEVYFPEVAAVYLGFGFHFLKKKEHSTAGGSGVFRGNINRDTIMRSIIATAIIRRQQPHFIVSQFDPQDQAWSEKRLASLFKTYNKRKQPAEPGYEFEEPSKH